MYPYRLISIICAVHAKQMMAVSSYLLIQIHPKLRNDNSQSFTFLTRYENEYGEAPRCLTDYNKTSTSLTQHNKSV